MPERISTSNCADRSSSPFSSAATSHAESIDLAREIESWRADLVQYGLDNLTIRSVQMINPAHGQARDMTTEEGTESASQLNEVMADIRHELVRRVAGADRDANRDIYDALETE